MFLISLFKGIFIGLVVSVPTGPIGFLTIKRTINDGFWAGFFTGLGVVMSDLIYAIIVIVGLRHTSEFFTNYKLAFNIVGGFILIILGLMTYFSKKDHSKKSIEAFVIESRFGQFLSAFVVTMLNPIQIIAFTALIGPLAMFHNSFNLSLIFLLGLLLGSLVWWTSLSFIISKIRNTFTEIHIKLVNRIAGVVVTFSGVFILMRIFWN